MLPQLWGRFSQLVLAPKLNENIPNQKIMLVKYFSCIHYLCFFIFLWNSMYAAFRQQSQPSHSHDQTQWIQCRLKIPKHIKILTFELFNLPYHSATPREPIMPLSITVVSFRFSTINIKLTLFICRTQILTNYYKKLEHLLIQVFNYKLNYMGKFNNHRKSDKSSSSRQMFFDTIKDMRKLVQKNSNSYTADTLGLGKKTKMPYNHLIGRRNTIKQKYKHQKSRAHEESIQYDSNMKLLNSELLQKKRQKDDFQRNKYKFEGHQGGRVGRQTNQGFLQIRQKDLDRIYGKDSKNQNKGKNNKGKRSKKGKNKKGNKKFIKKHK